jgi:N-acetylneuraminic acid mutarotase
MPDGRVLVSGGSSSAPSIAQAEVYNPMSGTWSATGSNITPRQEHAATLLLDGRVFVVGGVGNYFSCSFDASAETYDAGTGLWASTASVPFTVGTGAIAVTLNDGRVLVAGGGNRCGGVFSTSALYDPIANSWSVMPSMSVAREFGSAVLLGDGRVLVAGGIGSSPFPFLTSTEIFDPSTQTWSSAGSMSAGRGTGCDGNVQSYLALLSTGDVFAPVGASTGSCFGSSVNPAVDLFNAATTTWSSAASMGTARVWSTPTLLSSGKVLVAGGLDSAFAGLSTAEVYDPSTDTWAATGALGGPRFGHMAVRLLNGSVLIVGGQNNSGATATAEIYGSVDTTPPTVACASPDGLWHNANVTLACTASDSDSGLANPADASFGLSTSVAAGAWSATAATGSRTVCDVAGNCATAGPISGNMIDRAAPTVTISTPTASTVVLGQQITSSYACADNGAGVGTCAGSVPNGSAIDTTAIGNKTFTVTATDGAGNMTTANVGYVVAYGICPLFDMTKAHKADSTIPIKLSLCTAAGVNVSSADVTVVATSIHLVSTSAPGDLQDAGNANPDNQFRYADGSYIFNLSLKGFSQGTYALVFTVGNDPSTHTVQFQVR